MMTIVMTTIVVIEEENDDDIQYRDPTGRDWANYLQDQNAPSDDDWQRSLDVQTLQ
jgi:hypothetical protein